MPKESDILNRISEQFENHGLINDGWTFVVVDDESRHGFTHINLKVVEFSRSYWPTLNRNIEELILHEIAHALCGHGEHDLEWWDKLIDIGGRGIWVEYPDKITRIFTTVVY